MKTQAQTNELRNKRKIANLKNSIEQEFKLACFYINKKDSKRAEIAKSNHLEMCIKLKSLVK